MFGSWYNYHEATITLVFPKLGLFLWKWTLVTNLNFLIPISLHHDGVNLWYFKLRPFDLTEFIVWNIKGLLGIRKSEFVTGTQFLWRLTLPRWVWLSAPMNLSKRVSFRSKKNRSIVQKIRHQSPKLKTEYRNKPGFGN